ncbi:unnamed protein product [Tenebrio molitor]|nr:unnamed protein product [Tenebrio molitor]
MRRPHFFASDVRQALFDDTSTTSRYAYLRCWQGSHKRITWL